MTPKHIAIMLTGVTAITLLCAVPLMMSGYLAVWAAPIAIPLAAIWGGFYVYRVTANDTQANPLR